MCDEVSYSAAESRAHRKTHVLSRLPEEERENAARGGAGFIRKEGALSNSIERFRYTFQDGVFFADTAYSTAMPLLLDFLHHKLNEHGGFMKAQVCFSFEMVKLRDATIIDAMAAVYFNSKMDFLTHATVGGTVQSWLELVDEKLEAMVSGGSGWTVSQVRSIFFSFSNGIGRFRQKLFITPHFLSFRPF
jgi:hypothetical protein